MIRMEIACFFMLLFVAFIYFSAGKRHSKLHNTFSLALCAMLVHLVLDAISVYSVNHLDTIPLWMNDTIHRLFIGSMIVVIYLFYQYITILVEEETGKPRKLGRLASAYFILAEIGVCLLPIHYAVTPAGNYSDGIHANLCYISVAVYLVLIEGMFFINYQKIEKKKRRVIGFALVLMVACSIIQSFHPTWLFSGMGLSLVTLSFYLTLENPEILRAELVEQKMSMLYLKSQVNPHFLYNTLDTIRIQAQLNEDKEVANLLMRLVDFFRLSVKVDHQMVELETELEMIEAYLELMCYRYPSLECEYDIDPELEGNMVPNFILQPMVENSLLHGLKNNGYKGTVKISAQKVEGKLQLEIYDTGSGFEEGKKEIIDEMLLNYAKHDSKLTGNSIGVLNVQKRIKLLCGDEYGLTYIENPEGGVTAKIILPLE